MNVKEIRVKSCMTKSKLTDYVINPYTGCEHGCKYCYADFIRIFQNIKDKWGDFVFIKANCPELLIKELEKNKPGHIWMSSVCDCYMPLEEKYKLTRKILEIIANSPYKNKFTIEILTKSALVRRDFDLLKKLNAELGLSINNLDEKTARILEPFASSPSERIKTLKEAKKSGIRVFGFISPVFPGITNLEDIFKELSFCDYVWVEFLNMKKSVLNRLMPIIRDNFPDKVGDFEFAINNPEEYHEKMKKQVRELEKKYKLKVIEIVIHQELNLK
ncbi:MAG: radical SAM protein [Candidatus Nanoarchaeia archaeon]|nr:radical SAM protein [Candidatus Nanoarchaeia archaeon]MDD5741788.1 radical SAM protein [Candidatus Nanoarchaeia archaeon]